MDITKLIATIPAKPYYELMNCTDKFKIDTPLRLAHFLAQCDHESSGFKFTTENLNYSADGLLATFSKYFNKATALTYARSPERIANRVYANRMGNSDESNGDGWKFRGRGYIQLTGRENYSKFNAVVDDDIVINPELVAEKYALLSAAWFWDKHHLNDLADIGSDGETVKKITIVINGGLNGFDDRLKLFKKYYKILL